MGSWSRLYSPSFEDRLPGEVRAVLHSTVRRGPVFLAYLAVIPLMILIIFVRSDIIGWGAVIAFFFVLIGTIIKVMDNSLKEGPLIAWFSPRTERVWLRIDEDDLVVRLPGKKEAYRPTKLLWLDATSFKLTEGKVVLHLTFESSDDASRLASMISRQQSESCRQHRHDPDDRNDAQAATIQTDCQCGYATGCFQNRAQGREGTPPHQGRKNVTRRRIAIDPQATGH